MELLGANPSAQPLGQDRTEAVFSYFWGPAADWKTGLPSYAGVAYADVWPGIDMVYGQQDRHLKYSFVVQPGSRPEQVRFAYAGAASHLNEAGQLVAETPLGSIVDDRPVAYQDIDGRRVAVEAAFRHDPDAPADGGGYGFEVGAYDPRHPLVLDPVVFAYLGYIGGNGPFVDGLGSAIAVDPSGNAYVVGQTNEDSSTFPATVGPSTVYRGGFGDAYVAKVKADGTGLLYAGYIGGEGVDIAYGVAVDGAGNAYVTGATQSQTTFPTRGPLDTTFGGMSDAFATKVNAAGTDLVYAGYLGGQFYDEAYAIAIQAGCAANCAAFVTGVTGKVDQIGFPNGGGCDFPRTGGPDCRVHDAFVTRINADGSGRDYSIYLGSIGLDEGHGIAVDAAGNAYVAGTTGASGQPGNAGGFPLVGGPDASYNGDLDAFITKVRADGTGFVYSGFIGGDNRDGAYGVAVDAAGAAYVTGNTNSLSNTFPVRGGPFLQASKERFASEGGGRAATDVFVTKVEPSGAGLVYSGFFGGQFDEYGFGIAVDAAGSAYVTGITASNEQTFPVVGGPDLTYGGNEDAFIAKVRPDGAELSYAGYIGGSVEDSTFNINLFRGGGVAVDSAGNAYYAGTTRSLPNTLPVTVGPDLTYDQGGRVTFVGKIVDTASGPPVTCEPRPKVVVQATRGAAGVLNVTITAGQPAGVGNDRLVRLEFGGATNARIDVPAGPDNRPALTSSPGNAALELTERPASLTFTVRRAQAGQATTVPILVFDSCGSWPTFVGGGPAAF